MSFRSTVGIVVATSLVASSCAPTRVGENYSPEAMRLGVMDPASMPVTAPADMYNVCDPSGADLHRKPLAEGAIFSEVTKTDRAALESVNPEELLTDTIDPRAINLIYVPIGFTDPINDLNDLRGLVAANFPKLFGGDWVKPIFLNKSVPLGIEALGSHARFTSEADLKLFTEKFRSLYPDEAIRWMFIINNPELYLAWSHDSSYSIISNDKQRFYYSAFHEPIHPILYKTDEYMGKGYFYSPNYIWASSGNYTTTQSKGFNELAAVMEDNPDTSISVVPAGVACNGFQVYWPYDPSRGGSDPREQNIARMEPASNEVILEKLEADQLYDAYMSARARLFEQAVKRALESDPQKFRGKY